MLQSKILVWKSESQVLVAQESMVRISILLCRVWPGKSGCFWQSDREAVVEWRVQEAGLEVCATESWNIPACKYCKNVSET